ncbi:MAG: thioredoxin family protein [Hyphomicrobiales bacterium]
MDQPTTEIVRCPACNAGNRIPVDRIGSSAAKCGKCKASLFPERTSTRSADSYKMRCSQCGARNRIPGAKLEAAPKCGKCGSPLKTGELFTPQPVMVTDGNFDAQVLKSPLPVLVFAWAPWCPTCGAAAPIIDQFAADAKGQIRVGKLNVDANPELANRYSILSVPSLFIFDNGEMKDRILGALQKHELMLKLAPYI